MKKWEKGIHKDNLPQNQPEGTFPHGKNGIMFENMGSVQNEPGFRKVEAPVPGPVVGTIETDSKPVFLIVIGGKLKIYYFDPETETFDLRLDTATLTNTPVFDPNNYFTGESQRNYKGELIISITNKVQPLLYINCDVPGVTDFTQLFQFPAFSPPTVTTTMEGGGGLVDGSYFLFMAYGRQDGAKTQYTSIGIPIRIGVDTQGRSIKIELSNLDQNYDDVFIGVLVRSTEDKVFELDPVPFGAGNLTIFYTGSETTTVITREELLVQPPNYTKVGTVGQLNDAQYLGDLEIEEEFDWQPFANMLTIGWVSRPVIAVGTPDELMSTGQELGFMHQEVYSFYARLNYANGRKSKCFAIPGPSIPGASDVITIDTLTDKKFRIQDTCPSFDPITRTGEMGVWINETETYPNHPSFDSSALGGLDLRGVQVRHHRFPSVFFMRSNIYQGNGEYGKTQMDLLGIQVRNVIIPAQLQGKVYSVEILFAKRSISNSTIIGQAMYLMDSKKFNEPIINPPNGYVFTGGNWSSQPASILNLPNPERLEPVQKYFRTHSFDMLFYKPKTDVYFVQPQYKLRKGNLRQEGWIEDGDVPPSQINGPIDIIVDYTKGSSANQIAANNKRWKVLKSKYLPQNAWVEDRNNAWLEGAFGGVLDIADNYDIGLTISKQFPSKTTHSDVNKMADFEETWLVNLVASRTNLYSSVFSQQLVSTNRAVIIGGPVTDMYGGDSYVIDYSFHTYGWTDWKREAHFPSDDKAKGGYRIARRIVCESSANLYLRFEEVGNIYSKWYPHSPLVGQDPNNYLTAFRSDNDPNQFGYKKEFSLLNDLIGSIINNPARPPLTSFPYRIHRTGKTSRQSKYRSWRNILPLDYYEMQKNMGRIINLEGQDDTLLIHMENSLFVTRDKTVLQGDKDLITLGSGDIFQFEPQEPIQSKLGYAGTKHELAAIKTAVGYMFVDATVGEVFLYKGKLQMLNQGLIQFFRQYLKIKEKNPFIGNGITIGYDRVYKRLLMTVKNRQVTSNVVIVNLEDDLVVDQSVIEKYGKLLLYKGPNNTAYDCPGPVLPNINDFSISVAENTAIGTHLTTVVGTNVLNFYLLNHNDKFEIEAATGEIILTGALDYESVTQYLLTIRAVSSTGDTDEATITVNVVDVNEPPSVSNYDFTVAEDIPVGNPVGQVVGSDPENAGLVYTIIAGNEDGKFAIGSSNGVISVISPLDFETSPSYTIEVQVSDGVNQVQSQVRIFVTNVDEHINPPDFNITIEDTTADGAVVFDPTGLSSFQDPEGDVYEYSIHSASVPGVFSIDPTTGKVSLLYNSSLDPRTTPIYSLVIQFIEIASGFVDTYVLTINVEFDLHNITWEPATPACDGTCPVGYLLSSDGTVCYKDETIDAIPPTGGPGDPLYIADSREHPSWGELGARIYSTYDAAGAPTGPVIDLTTQPWQVVIPGQTSRVNRISIWAALHCGAHDWQLISNTWIGFSRSLLVPTTKTYYIAIAGDNRVSIRIDGTLIVEFPNSGDPNFFKRLHIYPVTLAAGLRIINIQGMDDGAVSAMFACEIYDMTSGQIIAATSDVDLVTVYSTRGEFCQPFDLGPYSSWSCPGGYSLDMLPIPPVCKRTLTVAPSAGSGVKRWAQVVAKSSRYGSAIVATFSNTAGQTWQGQAVPFYNAVVGHIDCGGAVVPVFSVMKSGTAQRNNCLSGAGSIEEYVVAAGFYMSLVSQADADTMAQNDVDTNKQAYANTVGTC